MRLAHHVWAVVLAACAVPVTPPVRSVPDVAAWLPRAAGRCLVVMPALVDAAHAEQIVPISQSDGLPYRLGLASYARVDQERGRVELLRFASPPSHAVVHAQLARTLEQCGLAGCEPARSDWVDPRTLRIERGVIVEGDNACAASLREHPRALELAVRPAALQLGELREVHVVLELHRDGVERVSTRRYASPETAERALRAALRGQEELPTLAGVPADGFGVREGDALTQRTFASFADLELALDGQRRRQTVDPSDRASVYAAFDAAPERTEPLLLAARELALQDDGLLRRHFQLLFTRDPRAAFELAEAGQGEPWQLRRRAAQARFDEAALARALEAVHSLRDGARMAREIAQHVWSPFEDPAAGEERAEYTFLAAARIAKARVARGALALRFPVLEVVRVLTTLAQVVHEGGVEVLVAGKLLTAADDAQLRTLGNALAEATGEGPFELRMAFGQRATVLLSGRREGGWLLVDSGSRALRGLHADAIERLIAAPLRQLTGSAFPPDELVLEARDEAELSTLEQSASRVARCRREGLTLRCRGGLADANAAHRALLEVARDQLTPDARLLWSGPE